MDTDLFMDVARTIFPFIVEVELNSQGDPLLHPDIETVFDVVAAHGCDLKLQTNGTLFSDKVIEKICEQHGTIMLSLDAVGPKFDEVRRGGLWAKAEPQLLKFLRLRDPSRLRVGLYPTVTGRTVGEALNIVQWAHDQGIEDVCFHQYSPIQNSFEVVPSTSESGRMRGELSEFVARTNSPMTILVDGSSLNPHAVPDRRSKFADERKRRIAFSPTGPGNMFPTTIGTADADPLWTCNAPRRTVDIGLDAQIAACCRAQDVVLGYASSVTEFADAWLGPDYARLRASLDRDADMPYPLPNCRSCIDFYAPSEARNRASVDYKRTREFPVVLVLRHLNRIALTSIQKEQGFCYIARIPPTADPNEYCLYEGDGPLGPAEQLHDDIRREGAGRFSIWGTSVYFSSSDNSDPRRNQRGYTLRRRSEGVDPRA
jgi:MoaA/NifB/PqqE/SkfB family radical SAM enzyme